MQKKVLAAVIGSMLVAPAVFADSANVTISGRISGGFEQYKLSGGTNAGGYHAESRVSDQSSSVIFSGSEDLGGGTKAIFQVDNRFSLDLGSFAASGNTFVGLAGGFGQVRLGRLDLHYHEANVVGGLGRSGSLQSWLAPGPVSQMNGNVVGIGTRSANVIAWDSNNMGGVTARVAYSTRPDASEGSGAGADGSSDGAWNAAIRWSSGPLTLGASYWDQKTEGKPASGSNDQVGDNRGIKGWVGYTFGAVQVGLIADNSEWRLTAGENMTKRTAFAVPLTFKSGNETFVASFAKMGKQSGGAASQVNDATDASAIAIGWDHAMSKRTSVGAYYTKLDNKANATYDLFAIGLSGTATAAGEDATQIYFGIAHTY